jgi:hypothetical protein
MLPAGPAYVGQASALHPVPAESGQAWTAGRLDAALTELVRSGHGAEDVEVEVDGEEEVFLVGGIKEGLEDGAIDGVVLAVGGEEAGDEGVFDLLVGVEGLEVGFGVGAGGVVGSMDAEGDEEGEAGVEVVGDAGGVVAGAEFEAAEGVAAMGGGGGEAVEGEVFFGAGVAGGLEGLFDGGDGGAEGHGFSLQVTGDGLLALSREW